MKHQFFSRSSLCMTLQGYAVCILPMFFCSRCLSEYVSLRVTQEVHWCVWSEANGGSWQGLWAGVRAARGWIAPVSTHRWWSSLTGSVSRLKDRCDCTPDWHEQNDGLNIQDKGFTPGVHLQTVSQVLGVGPLQWASRGIIPAPNQTAFLQSPNIQCGYVDIKIISAKMQIQNT